MRTLFLSCIFIITSCGVGSQQPRSHLDGKSISDSSDNYRWMIQYGYVGNKLAVVAFAGTSEDKAFEGLVVFGTDESWVTKPDGMKIKLPSDVQLYENIDGAYQESKEHVEGREFEAFLKSKPKQYTIKALLAFVKTQREKTDKANDK
jgi:hypothetical protein